MRIHFFKFTNYPILLFALYKIHFFAILLQKNLHISKKSSTFAMKIKEIHNVLHYIFTIRFYSQKYIIFAPNLKTAQNYNKILI